MGVASDIALRFMRVSSRGGRPILAMTVIALLGITIGVATLIVTTSIADGFGSAYKKAILDFSADVVLLSVEEMSEASGIGKKLEKFSKEIRAMNPFLYREGLLIWNGEIRGVSIKGVSAEGVSAVSDGNISVMTNGVSLGKALADEMGLHTGDAVRLILPQDMDSGEKGYREFTVTNTFESGMYDYDSQFVLLDLKKAQEIFGVPNTVTGIEIKMYDPDAAPEFARIVEKEFDYPTYASDWRDLNKSLFEAVKLEKIMFAIIMGALVIVAAFNIIGTVMLRILYKTSDIAVLRALGMRVSSVRRTFTLQGSLIGLAGTIFGVGVALIIIWSLQSFQWLEIPKEVYLIKTLPVCISWRTIIMVSTSSIGVGILVSYIASVKVSEVAITKGLHRK